MVTKEVPDFALMLGVPAKPNGWMCRCAVQLKFVGAKATCEACGEKYVLDGGVVREAWSRNEPQGGGRMEIMGLIAWTYEKISGQKAPESLRRDTVRMLFWKRIRKYLNVSVIPFIPLSPLRVLGYRLVGFKIGKNVFIGMQCYLDDSHPNRLVIEDDVTISYRVTFATHGPRMPKTGCVLHRGCYIGTNATLLGGVEIGEYATVGACTLVNKSVPPFSTVVGVPCRVIKTGTAPYTTQEDVLREREKKEKAEATGSDDKGDAS